MKIHSFGKSLEIGSRGEDKVKHSLISLGYLVTRIDTAKQIKYGYDLLVEKGGKRYGIEVKTDAASNVTGNVFIETEVDGKRGWFRKYRPDSKVVMAYALEDGIYFLTWRVLKELDLTKYPSRRVWNRNKDGTKYSAEGYLVPVKTIKRLATKVIRYE